ncbi:GAF domain-containing protein [Aliagarivorans taiwanensis]|uniref:GAF domain-containing protein n=1 Tax=Aliagarivorans taiwanensis TaxID=561966 RepID=UPI00041476CF
MTASFDYQLLAQQVSSLLDPALPRTTNLANFSALLFDALPELNWAGCYLYHAERDQLVLGPFQGKPACTLIPVGRGVCGSAYLQATTLRVDDVHQFEGHIACDAASESEIVIPLYANEQLIGVIDLDSPVKQRFSEHDQQGLELVVRALEKSLGDADF